MSHTDLVRNSSYNPLLLFPFFPLLGFLFVSDFLWVMNCKTYLEEATKTTVYRLKKYCFYTTGIMSHDPFTDFLSSSRLKICV